MGTIAASTPGRHSHAGAETRAAGTLFGLPNGLIATLPEADQRHMMAHAESVEMRQWQLLGPRGVPATHVYFPYSGCVSLLAVVDDRPGPELGSIGRDGVVGLQVVLGQAVPPWHALVNTSGRAWRMEAAVLRHAMLLRPALRQALERYQYSWMVQVATSAGCMRMHSIEQRLARWLVMHHDCVGHGHIQVTHEVLATLLGVRRVGVTRAAGLLMRRGLIAYRHGELQMLDLPGLAQAACSCYASQQALRRVALPASA